MNKYFSTVVIICAMLGLIKPTYAQSDRLDTIAEVAACAVLDRVVQDLTDRIDEEKRWIERNRNNRNISADRFNQRVDENNGVVDEQNKLNNSYKRHCEKKSMSKAHARQVCADRTANMSSFLYHSPFCEDMRRALENK